MTQVTSNVKNPRFEAPPCCIESEKVVLSILMNNNTMLEVLSEHSIGPEHFSIKILREIYLSCCEIFDGGQNLDATIVIDHLRLKNKFFEDTIDSTIIQLYNASYLSDVILTHVQKLLEFHHRRKVYHEGYALIRKSLNNNEEFKVTHNELDTFNARELMNIKFPEQLWVVKDIIPDGLSIICGRPKLGKSRAVFDIAVAVAKGERALGKIQVEKSGVLYLALEDSMRRLNKRLGMILQGGEAPDNLYILTKYKTIDNGGLEILDRWLKQHCDVRLVVIDTLAKVKGKAKRGSELYLDDYVAVSKIKDVADKNSVAILMVHHTRKASADDYLDTVSGTTGITGAVDTVLVLSKDRGSADAVLHITGRDVEEQELALKSNLTTLGWVLLGDSIAYRISEERQDILDVINNSSVPIRTKDIAAALEKKPTAVSRLLTKLLDDNLISKSGKGYTFNSSI